LHLLVLDQPNTFLATERTSAQKVGTLYYPHLPNMVGFGHFKIQSDGDDCCCAYSCCACFCSCVC
jgi:hypothetical protein